MSHIGREVKEGKIVRIPAVKIVSVPERPSERAARRRKLWEGPQPEPMPEPVKVPEKLKENR
jgi:hypothetical protein